MQTQPVQVGILGATGFTGVELVRLLLRHGKAEIIWLSSESQAGTSYETVYPALAGRLEKSVAQLIPMEKAFQTRPDVVFSCLPHGASATAVKAFLENGHTRVIDLSADFRLSPEAVFGLSEIHRGAIAKAKLVANPGCYPTSILLPLIPLIQTGCIQKNGILADSKSGVSGAGRKATEGTHFVFCNENFSAYKIGDQHRHLPEIRAQLQAMSGAPSDLLFTPHLVPMERGILSTIYAELTPGKTAADVAQAWNASYANSPFVRSVSVLPQTSDVARSNQCRFYAYQPAGTARLIVVSVLDNMVKGASGQALQNLNIMFGLNETEGLL